MILALGLVAQAQARICTAVASGNWSTASTWSCGTVPTAGDTLIIPASRQVTINANIPYSGSHMAVIVYGTWRFDGGGAKITMPCGSAAISAQICRAVAGHIGSVASTQRRMPAYSSSK